MGKTRTRQPGARPSNSSAEPYLSYSFLATAQLVMREPHPSRLSFFKIEFTNILGSPVKRSYGEVAAKGQAFD